MPDDRIVAVAFLTAGDLKVLGQGFTRHLPLPDDDSFADLLAKLDLVEVEPLGKGIVIHPVTKQT